MLEDGEYHDKQFITGANILNDERSMLQDEIFFEFLNEKAIVSDDILKGFYFDNDFIGS